MYSIDMNEGILILNFTEIVDGSSLDLTSFVIQNNADSMLATQQVALLNTVVTESSPSYEIPIDREDLNAIRLSPGLVTSQLDTFLTFSNGSVVDNLGNQIVGPDMGIPPAVFIPDTTGPILESFNLDFGQGLELNFSEPVDVSTLLVTAFTLQTNASLMSLDGSNSFRLTLDSSPGVGPNSDMVSLVIGAQDLNSIRSFEVLVTSPFLSVTTTAVQDLVGNPIQEIPSVAALPVSQVLVDSTGPILQSFVLDLNTGELFLTFGETILASSLDLTLFRFQDAMLSPTETVELTSGNSPWLMTSRSPFCSLVQTWTE